MFATILYSDKEKVILKNATEDSIKLALEDAKKEGYTVREKTRIRNRNREVSAVIYQANRKPKYIWE